MPQLALPIAAETAVAGTMTAAEIAAAEAAAQAAAEAAAAEAATQAAAQAAAEQAAQQAAAQAASEAAAQQAAQQASTSGIQTLAQEVGANANPTGIEQVFQQAQANNIPMSQAEFLNNSFAGPAEPLVNAANYPGSVGNPLTPIPQAPVNTVAPSVAPTMELPAAPAVEAPAVAQPPAPPAPTLYGSAIPEQTAASMGQTVGPNTLPPIEAPLPVASGVEAGSTIGDPYKPFDPRFGPSTPVPGGGGLSTAMTGASVPTETGGLENLLNQGIEYAKQHPLQTGLGAMTAYNYLNRPKPYERPKYKSTFNAGAYSGYEPATPNYYRPQYAHGGLADLGGYSDYARGGRMLKGPGDGMSDDIPATIANKQPARLANEEFVVPADVVSHLGNGSSEAGAKQLYKMMDRVRKARTGTKKQGKQINPEKYLA